ncbi:MAG: hypothetical protein ACM3VT_03005 [Solirubrobacterales bacterium]
MTGPDAKLICSQIKDRTVDGPYLVRKEAISCQLRIMRMDWTAVLVAEDQNPRARLATEILASPAYDSTTARVKAFTQQGGGCRATFFNYRR